jgi:ATP-dependent helicase/nuclease subunit A
VTVTDADAAAAEAAIAARWRIVEAATYDLRAAKEIALSAAELHRRTPSGEHGTEWGTVIHFLIEAAVREPARDLLTTARAALEEQGLPTARAPEALAVVDAVRASEIWRRAAGAERTLVEVPFEICLSPGDDLLPGLAAVGEGWQSGAGAVPVLVRGVVDLAFREAAGWVIVDWKTDAARTPAELAERVRRYAPQVRLYAEIWTRITGEAVSEAGLFFTAGSRYEPL